MSTANTKRRNEIDNLSDWRQKFFSSEWQKLADLVDPLENQRERIQVPSSPLDEVDEEERLQHER